MTRWPVVLIVFGVSFLGFESRVACAAPASQPAAELAVSEDIKAAYEKGDYPETLKLIGRSLALKGKAARGIDRYALLMLKAEVHLKLRATSNAINALEDAVKEAKAVKDDKGMADAKALMILIKRSRNLQYTPKVAAKRDAAGPFDITDPKLRPDAIEALYVEEKAAVMPKVQDAKKAKVLPPIATALKSIVPIKDIEVAATGRGGETAATTKDLVDLAHKLMAKGLDDMVRRTATISERAEELVTRTVTRADGLSETRTRRRGLGNDDAKELKGMIEDCKRIVQSCKELAESFTDDTEPFEDLEDQAKDVAERANDVMTDNYSSLR